jgi:hypothetical protein
MATPVTFYCLTEDILKEVHQAHTDTFKILLTNTAPSRSHTVKADLTEISAGNGYAAGGFDVQNAVSRTLNVSSVTAVDYTLTASGGSIGPYRYAALYNDTATGDPLIAYIDKGVSVTLTDGQTDLFDFGSSLFTMTATT